MLGALLLLGAGVVIFIPPAMAHMRRQRHLYTLTNYKLEMQYGLLSKTIRNVPLSKIQDVTVEASAWKRLLGIGDVNIDNADEREGGSLVLADVRDPKSYADTI